MDIKKQFALEAIQDGANMTALCKAYGVSKPTGYKWKDRYLREGAKGLDEQSRRPTSSPRGLDEAVVCKLVRLKTHHRHWGPKKIRELYHRQYSEAPSLSSVKRVLERAGLVQKRKRRPQAQSGRLHSDQAAQSCNDVWTVDFKGWWRTGDNGQCTPLTVRDEYSRYILCATAVKSASTEKVRYCFEELFKRYGLPKRIRSDNGPPFACTRSIMGLSTLSSWWLALGINLERGRLGKPQDNGAHERMHRDLKLEIQCHAKGTVAEQQTAIDIWCRTYNEERPHEALGMRTPSEIYTSSESKWQGTPEDLTYPNMITRRVHKTNGTIKYEQRYYKLSTTLGGWSVGLLPAGEGLLDVYFAQLKLGQIDTETLAFLRADVGPQETQAIAQ